MPRRFTDSLVAVIWDTPMWVFLLVGLVFVSANMLVGPMLDNHKLAWQRDVIRAYASRLEAQEKSYRDLLAGLDANDPVLIERLAFHYLHLKPVGKQLLLERRTGPRPGVQMVAERLTSVDQWLYRPLPEVGVDYPRYSALNNSLVRFTTGPTRMTLLGIGVACVVFGLIPLGSIMSRPAASPQSEIGCETSTAQASQDQAEVVFHPEEPSSSVAVADDPAPQPTSYGVVVVEGAEEVTAVLEEEEPRLSIAAPPPEDVA